MPRFDDEPTFDKFGSMSLWVAATGEKAVGDRANHGTGAISTFDLDLRPRPSTFDLDPDLDRRDPPLAHARAIARRIRRCEDLAMARACMARGGHEGRPTRILVNEHLLPHQKLDVYRVARELALRVHAAKIRDRELRDQATRASKSCFLCLCEGLPNEGAALRHKYFVESRNSLAETVGAMDLAAAIGVVRQDDADTVQELGSRLRRMLSALMR
jgi:four helix bundle protein